MNTVTIKYNSSVLVPAGWRSVEITARAELNKSGKKAQVLYVLDVDGLGISGYGSRTGANRQTFHVGGIAQREVGVTKIVSKCKVLN